VRGSSRQLCLSARCGERKARTPLVWASGAGMKRARGGRAGRRGMRDGRAGGEKNLVTEKAPPVF